jgi:predicted metal-binding protein
MVKHALFVCKTCASTWKDGRKIGISGGEQLLEKLSQIHRDWHLSQKFSLESVACMSACNRACTISFVAENKYNYLFGDLSADAHNLEEISAAILECASLYYAKANGLLAWSERPELLKKGIVARIPPVDF